MAGQTYEPIAPVNTNINGDDANKFAVKYKKEIDHIYSILRGIEQSGGSVVVDDTLSATSPNPVQNKAIMARLNNMYTKAEITQMLAALSGGGSGGAYGEANSYKVTITQSAHQTIKVRKYLAASSTLYTATFTAGEPFWTIEVSSEADEGYIPGDIIVNGVPYSGGGTFVLDRDFTIYANDAVAEAQSGWTTIYVNGTIGALWGNGSQQDTWFWRQYGNRTCTQDLHGSSPTGKVIVVDVTPSSRTNTVGRGIFGNTEWGSTDQIWRNTYVTELQQNVRTKDLNTLQCAFRRMTSLTKVDIGNFNTKNCLRFTSMFLECSALRDLSGVTNLDTSELLYADSMFNGCSALPSIDLSGWSTPKLRTAGSMFSGCNNMKALDISGWNTSEITSFTAPPNVQYIVMDANEVKFGGSYIFSNPNNYVKYLVPDDMVLAYKNHPNWSGRATQIEPISHYTISRYRSKLDVSANV